jgi:hypothetical protein
VLHIARCLMAPANHLHEYRDELGRTRRIFLNGIPHYRKQLLSETNVLPTIHIIFPAIRPRSCTIVTWIQPFPMTRDSRRLPTNMTSPTTRRFPYHTDCVCRYLVSTNRIRPLPCHPHFCLRTLSHTGRTYRVPDTDPSDEAEDIPTQPVPHFTRRIN